MNYHAFSHGQTQSKIWLCESLEPYIPDKAIVAILGSWYNVLGFMMLTRNRNKYQSILGIDIDTQAIEISSKVNAGWMIGDSPKMNNIVADANTYNYQGFTLVINCSPEHMPNDSWFDNITPGTLVCIQTSDIDINDEVWKVVNPCRSMKELAKKYPLSHTILLDTQDITYSDWGYKRFMLIGVK